MLADPTAQGKHASSTPTLFYTYPAISAHLHAAAVAAALQVTVPGFTDALVSRVSEADLVPQFASALVAQVKDSGLVGHAVDAALGRVGQQLSSVLCPWKWRLGMPWQQQQQQQQTEQQEK
jgi:hypothetical protein